MDHDDLPIPAQKLHQPPMMLQMQTGIDFSRYHNCCV